MEVLKPIGALSGSASILSASLRSSYREAFYELLASDDSQLTDSDYPNLGAPVPVWFRTYLCRDAEIVTSWSLGPDDAARVIVIFLMEERIARQEMTAYIARYEAATTHEAAPYLRLPTDVPEELRYTLTAEARLAALYHRQERFSEAGQLFAELISSIRLRASFGNWGDSVALGNVLTSYASCLIHLKRYEDAEVALSEAHPILVEHKGAGSRDTLRTVRFLAELYDAWGKPEQAAEWRAKLATEQEAVASDKAGQSSSDEKQDE